jgi:hypothetical protein
MEQKMKNLNLAETLKGGVIMDVTTPEQAKIAEDAGACAVMALERVPGGRTPSSTSFSSRAARLRYFGRFSPQGSGCQVSGCEVKSFTGISCNPYNLRIVFIIA